MKLDLFVVAEHSRFWWEIGSLIRVPLFWANVLVGLGLWLMLPRGNSPGRRSGMLVALLGLVLFGYQLPRFASLADESIFFILSAITVAACALSVSARSPVFCALWFGVVLVGTAGLFLIQGAQFLGVATIVVYAGAILVTFLFILMLADPEGDATYDRLSWDAFAAAATGALVLGVVITLTSLAFDQTSPVGQPLGKNQADNILANAHVAQLGKELFSRYLISVEVAGTLLLAALVGAVAIIAQGKIGEKVNRTDA